jgi:hypothetical protein
MDACVEGLRAAARFADMLLWGGRLEPGAETKFSAIAPTGNLAAIAFVQSLAHFLAGLEKRNRLFIHRDMRASARIAPDSRVPVLHGESAKPA